MNERPNPVKDKSFSFALRVIKLYTFLKEKNEFVLSKQILRSGTSIGANIRESQNAESKKDFIHKLSIAQKECDETLYWLELLIESEIISNDSLKSMHFEAQELLKLLKSIILSTKQNS